MPRSKSTCQALTRRGTPCQCKPLPGNRRCKFHGGLSTGPKTPEGRAQSAVNLEKACAVWLAPENAGACRAAAAQAVKTRERNRRWARWCANNPTTRVRVQCAKNPSAPA
jgi:hypothetical protein